MARLKPGVTMEQAKADISAIAGRIRDKDKRDRTFTIDVVPLRRVGRRQRAAGRAGAPRLGHARAADCVRERREPAAHARDGPAEGSRGPHGARRGLAAARAAAADGEPAARPAWAARPGLLIAKAQPVRRPHGQSRQHPASGRHRARRRVLAFTFAVSILTGLVFGLAPAIRAARVDLNTALKAGGQERAGRTAGSAASRRRLRSLLVVSEVALSLMLLIGAGLLVRSFVRLQSVSPGFDPGERDLHAARRQRHGSSRTGTPRSSTSARSGDRLASVPGVITARGAVTALPFTSSVGWGAINVEGWTPQPGQELQVDQRAATPDYFRTMEDSADQGAILHRLRRPAADAEPVAIIDEKFAQRFWPNGDADRQALWNDPKRQDDDRRRRRHGEAVRSRRRRPHRRLSPVAELLGYQVARTSADPAARRERHGPRRFTRWTRRFTVFDVRTMTIE